MRRITVKYAQPGLVLELPVYDNYGKLLMAQHLQLDKVTIGKMLQAGVPEIFVRDYRVLDVMVAPLFPPEAEGAVANAFRTLVLENQGKPSINPVHLSQAYSSISRLIGGMAQNLVGDAGVSCNIPLQEYIYLQPVKTAGLSLAVGHKLGMTVKELAALGTAALLKDIGLSPEVINTADVLSEGGSSRLFGHPLAGCKLLMPHQLTGEEIAEAVLQHHESWSGRGYPQGLKGKDISRNARIIAIADAFVDLLAERPTRGRYMPHEAIEFVMASGGDQFDPELVESFVRNIPSYPSGLAVQLNTGEIGIVINPKRGFVARPVVRVCVIPGKALKEPYDIDLSIAENQRTLITKVLEYD